MKPASMLAVVVLSLLPVSAEAVYHVDTLNVNRWRMPVSDWGPFGSAASWRAPTYYYLYGCGPWVGAIAGTDTLVTNGYNPNSGASEMRPGDSLGGPEDSLVRVYVSNKRWPPPLSRFPRAPQATRADQDLWTLFNDFEDSAHVPPGRPLGLQVYLTGYAWSHRSAQDMVFLQYEIENQSDDTLRRTYLGVGLDYDIGDASDDMYDALYREWVRGTGGDSVYVDHLAIGYDYYNRIPGWDSVGAFGVMFLRSPSPDRVSAIKKFTIEVDPVTDRDQYLMLAGYDYRTGVYNPIDTIDVAPADKRFLLASGPFDVAPGRLDTVVIVIIASTSWPDRYGLALLAQEAESVWTYGRQGLGEGVARPARLQALPNPFRGTTAVSLLPATDFPAELRIYDARGRLVRCLPASGRNASCVIWNGADSRGRSLPDGVYICRCGQSSLKLVKQ